MLVVFLASAAVWFAYFFFASDNFEIKTVNVTGIQNIPAKEMDGIIEDVLGRSRLGFFSNRNILLVSVRAIQEGISERYIVESTEIDRQFPFTLTIAVSEKLARLVLHTRTPVVIAEDPSLGQGEVAGESATSTEEKFPVEPEKEPEYTEAYLYLDVNGIAVSEGNVSNEDREALPIIQIQTPPDKPIKPGSEVMTREQVSDVFQIYQGLRASNTGIEVAYVIYDPAITDELAFATKEGWQGLMSRKINLETQIKKLALALAEKVGDRRKDLQYIDLRIQDRVYYKFH